MHAHAFPWVNHSSTFIIIYLNLDQEHNNLHQINSLIMLFHFQISSWHLKVTWISDHYFTQTCFPSWLSISICWYGVLATKCNSNQSMQLQIVSSFVKKKKLAQASVATSGYLKPLMNWDWGGLLWRSPVCANNACVIALQSYFCSTKDYFRQRSADAASAMPAAGL